MFVVQDRQDSCNGEREKTTIPIDYPNYAN